MHRKEDLVQAELSGHLCVVSSKGRKKFVLSKDEHDFSDLADILIGDGWNLADLKGRRVTVYIEEEQSPAMRKEK